MVPPSKQAETAALTQTWQKRLAAGRQGGARPPHAQLNLKKSVLSPFSQNIRETRERLRQQREEDQTIAVEEIQGMDNRNGPSMPAIRAFVLSPDEECQVWRVN